MCRTDEYPGATGYRCTIRQGKHVTNNTAMGYAATSVTLTPSDFETGPADVTMEVTFRHPSSDVLVRYGEVEVCSVRLRLEDKASV